MIGRRDSGGDGVDIEVIISASAMDLPLSDDGLLGLCMVLQGQVRVCEKRDTWAGCDKVSAMDCVQYRQETIFPAEGVVVEGCSAEETSWAARTARRMPTKWRPMAGS